MAKITVLNSVSLQLFDLQSMIGVDSGKLPGLQLLKVQTESPIQAGDEVISFVGHPDTAACAGVPVCTKKKMYKPEMGDKFWVYQLICPNGQRLPNGATSLPEGFKCLWAKVMVVGLH